MFDKMHIISSSVARVGMARAASVRAKWVRAAMMMLLLAPVRMLAVGWTPTDGGLVVNLNQGDKILISVMVDHDNNPATPDREYFVGNYTRYTGDDYFTYSAGQQLKLLQQDALATEPSDMTIWTVGAPLSRVYTSDYSVSGLVRNTDYSLGGLVYTIWNDGKTLRTPTNAEMGGEGRLLSILRSSDG